MIPSFTNVDKNFAEILLGIVGFTKSQLDITFTQNDGTTFTADLRVGNKAVDFSEEIIEHYPTVIMFRDTAEPRPSYTPANEPFYAALRKANNLSTYRDVITKFSEPIQMDFRYEVSVCAKDYDQSTAMNIWISKFNYGKQKHFTFNKNITFESMFGEVTDGDLVGYDMRKLSQPERSDGVMETIYEFILHPYLVIQEPVDMATIRDILVGVKRN